VQQLGGELTWDPDNLALLPKVVDVPGLDLHLGAGSPLRDAGARDFEPEPGELDVDGEPRVQGEAVDIGADEL